MATTNMATQDVPFFIIRGRYPLTCGFLISYRGTIPRPRLPINVKALISGMNRIVCVHLSFISVTLYPVLLEQKWKVCHGVNQRLFMLVL